MFAIKDAIDLDGCKPSFRYYGGSVRKEGILIGGEPWIAKFSSRRSGGSRIPYPVSEHVGSQVYRLLGIPAHETVLGLLHGKMVCACRDFTHPDKELVEFKKLKNSSPEDIPSVGSPCDGDAVYLHDVLVTISAVPPLVSTPGVVERFWDMFVVDAFIGNPDRNNGSWGLLRDSGGVFSLAPVYGCGGCLSGIEKPSGALSGISRYEEVCQRESRPIRPFEYMASGNPDLDAAVIRIAERIDMDAIFGMIGAIPGEFLSDDGKKLCKRFFKRQYEGGIELAARYAAKRLRLGW